MKSYRLVEEGGPRDAEWVLAWDELTLTLEAPDGQRVLEASPTVAHELIELYELYAEGKVCFATPQGPLAFKKHTAAVAAVRALVEAGLAGDPEHCAKLRQQSLRVITWGMAMFAVAGGLFALYCWWAFTAGDPPPGTWQRWVLGWFGWAIYCLLLVLMGVALAGPFMAYFGIRQWLRLRRIERLAAEAQSSAEPDSQRDPSDS